MKTRPDIRRHRSVLAGTMAALAISVFTTACARSPEPATPAEGRPLLLQISQGLLRGVDQEGVRTFRNIPYAAPPVGPLRWRRPQPAPAWTGERDAAAFGSDCVQNRPFWDDSQSRQTVSEDCLTLNVWAPKAEAPLPVMVWIHGGGFVMGSASQPVFDGHALAERGVIVVTFNYRLGRFGFFAHPALAADHPNEPQGNFGFMDQVAALTWVRDNIAAFGGDPSRVTLFGESAGGGSVLQLMLNPDARGLFQRAIVQSGGGRDRWPSLDEAAAVGRAFGDRNDAATAEALRALPADSLRGRLDILSPEKDTYSGPMIDGRLVMTSPVQGFASGLQAPVPLLIGATDNELVTVPAFLRGRLADETLTGARLQRNALEPIYGDDLNARAATDLTFVEPARRLAGLADEAGQSVWLYSFGYVAEAKRSEWAGAPHASELGYVFDTLNVVSGVHGPADQAAADRMADVWAGFARGEAPSWPAYDLRTDRLGLFDGRGVTAVVQPGAARLDALGALRDAR